MQPDVTLLSCLQTAAAARAAAAADLSEGVAAFVLLAAAAAGAAAARQAVPCSNSSGGRSAALAAADAALAMARGFGELRRGVLRQRQTPTPQQHSRRTSVAAAVGHRVCTWKPVPVAGAARTRKRWPLLREPPLRRRWPSSQR